MQADEPGKPVGVIEHVRRWRDRHAEFGENDDRLVSDVARLLTRFPGHTQLGSTLIDLATHHPAAWVRGFAVRSLGHFPQIIEFSLAAILAAIQDPHGSYGGGFDETTCCDAMLALSQLGPCAAAAIPQIQRAISERMSEEDSHFHSVAMRALIAVGNSEVAAEFCFAAHLGFQQDASQAAHLCLSIWPREMPLPAFFQSHADPLVQAAVAEEIGRW